MAIIPSKNAVTVITGDSGVNLDNLETFEVPYKAPDGTLQSSGLRMLTSGSLLAPVGFSVESGSIDFGDVLRLSESAGFLAFENMVDGIKYQLVDYAVPRTSASSKPYYFKLIEAQKKFQASAGNTVITTNPLHFEYTTRLTARTNTLSFNATQQMNNVRLRIMDKVSGIVVKYFPSKSAWLTGEGGTTFEVGDNLIDFQDTALIFQAGTVLAYDIQGDNIALSGTNGVPAISAWLQEGYFVGVADANDVANLQTQISTMATPFSGKYADLTGVPASFVPSQHTHSISEVNGLTDQLSALTSGIQAANSGLGGLATVATSGSYNDLTNKPNLFSGAYSDLSGKPVLFSGSYTDLTNQPIIPSAVTKTSQLTNDSGYLTNVTFPVVSVNGKTGTVVLTNIDVGAAPTSHTHAISDVTNLQNTLDSKVSTAALSGYATTASVTSTLGNYTTTQSLNNLLAGKFNSPTGFTTEYLRGDGSVVTFPIIPAAQVQSDWNATSGAAQILNKPSLFSGSYTDLINKPVLFSGVYSDLTGKPTLFSGSYTDLTNKPVLFDGTYASLTGKPTSFPPSAHTHVIADVTALQSALDAKAPLTSLPQARVFTNPTRTLNTAFQVSSTRDSQVVYSVDITVQAILIGGTSGRVYLEYANEVGFTTGVTVVASSGNSTGGVLSITNLGTANLAGIIPAGKFVRLRTANVTGTPTYAFQSAQEVLL